MSRQSNPSDALSPRGINSPRYLENINSAKPLPPGVGVNKMMIPMTTCFPKMRKSFTGAFVNASTRQFTIV